MSSVLQVLMLAILLQTLMTSSAERCRYPGDIICSPDCSAIQLCLTDRDNTYIHSDLEHCPTDHYCYASKKACITFNTCDPVNIPPFECTKSTVMPDPYNCTVFHVCRRINNTWDDKRAVCEDGYAFDSISKTCRLKLVDEPEQCSDNGVPYCRRQGETLPYVYNKNMFFLCKGFGEILYPVLYECKGGQWFVGDKCVNEA